MSRPPAEKDALSGSLARISPVSERLTVWPSGWTVTISTASGGSPAAGNASPTRAESSRVRRTTGDPLLIAEHARRNQAPHHGTTSGARVETSRAFSCVSDAAATAARRGRPFSCRQDPGREAELAASGGPGAGGRDALPGRPDKRETAR